MAMIKFNADKMTITATDEGGHQYLYLGPIKTKNQSDILIRLFTHQANSRRLNLHNTKQWQYQGRKETTTRTYTRALSDHLANEWILKPEYRH